jgi:hypothetical protein
VRGLQDHFNLRDLMRALGARWHLSISSQDGFCEADADSVADADAQAGRGVEVRRFLQA